MSPRSARFGGTRVLSAKTEACLKAIARGLLTQRELTRSEMLEDEVAVFAIRSSTGVDAAARRMRTHLAHAFVADMRRILQAACAPQAVMDALALFSCDQCDTLTRPKIPRSVSVPLTVAPLRDLAVSVKWLPSKEEDVRVRR